MHLVSHAVMFSALRALYFHLSSISEGECTQTGSSSMVSDVCEAKCGCTLWVTGRGGSTSLMFSIFFYFFFSSSSLFEECRLEAGMVGSRSSSRLFLVMCVTSSLCQLLFTQVPEMIVKTKVEWKEEVDSLFSSSISVTCSPEARCQIQF